MFAEGLRDLDESLGADAYWRQPTWKRVELRYVDLKAGRHLQVTAYDETQAHVTNHEDAAATLDAHVRR